MNNIYLETMPKDCLECPCRNSEFMHCNLIYCDHSIGYFNEDELDYKYIPINKDFEELICPLKPLSDALAEERKRVCNQAKVDIRSLFNSYASSLIDYCIWNKNADENYKLYNNFKRIINDRLDKVLDLFDKRIDQIERGE